MCVRSMTSIIHHPGLGEGRERMAAAHGHPFQEAVGKQSLFLSLSLSSRCAWVADEGEGDFP